MGNRMCCNSKQKKIQVSDKKQYGLKTKTNDIYLNANNPQDQDQDEHTKLDQQEIDYRENGDFYKGELEDKKRNGKGALFYNDGRRFEGFWVNGKKDRGAIIQLDGTRTLQKYIYQADNPSSVTIIRSNGEKFIGTLKNDRKDGFGTSTYLNGDRFEGQFRNDFRNGQGVYTKKYGTKLQGEWVNDRKSRITRIDEGGNQSIQSWTYDNNIAKMLSSNGDRYQGGMKNDKMQGKGKYFWSNGQVYDGQFHNDLRQGKGWYYWPDGDKLYGQFKLHNLEGRATFYSKNGCIEERIYKRGAICERVNPI